MTGGKKALGLWEWRWDFCTIFVACEGELFLLVWARHAGKANWCQNRGYLKRDV